MRQAAAVPWATSGSPAVDPRHRATLQPLLDDFQAAFGSMFHGLTGAACDAIYRPVRQPPYPINGYARPREWWVALQRVVINLESLYCTVGMCTEAWTADGQSSVAGKFE